MRGLKSRALASALVPLATLAAAPLGVGAAPETSPRAIARSALGYLLDVRIDVPGTSEVSLDPACFVLAEPASGPSVPPLHTLRISVVELRAVRYLRIESREPTVEPLARIAIRAGCPGEAAELREFLVAIDPDPRDSSIVRPQPAAPGATTVALAASPFRVRPGDTLDSIARNIHPRDRKRRAQLIEALRALNPSLAGVPSDSALDPAAELAFPDLKALSSRKPPPAIASTAPPSPVRPATSRPAIAPPSVVPAAPPQAPAETAPRKAAKPTPPPTQSRPAEAAPAGKAQARTSVKTESTPQRAPAPVKPAPGSEIRLRLSGAEVDLTRTRGISEERRRELRQRRALLDADDQMSTLLSMQNTVRQLETRLQDVQLKMATSASQPAPALPMASSTPPPSAPAAAIPESAVQAPAEPAKADAPEAAKPAAAAPAAPPVSAAAPAKPVAAPERPASAPAQTSPIDGSWSSWLPSPWILAGVGALLAGLLGLWAWTRRGAFHPPQGHRAPNARSEEDLPVLHDVHTEPPAAEADLRWNRVPKAPDPAPAPEPPRSETPQAAEPAQSAIDELEMLSAPAIPAEAPAMLVVDATPASDLDLPLDDRSAEDRVRRIEYMHGRFPELKSQTISIEDPDSVINAARLYFEEQQHDRACELLTFGVEERPQEVRYWLAQFEIFRLENMAAEFTELAGKFHVLFAYTPYWPKVCHIGRELDPGNPLFSAGRDVLAEDGQFDPVAENWLNAPMDFTADALMSDLRRELFDDHNVDRADFASLSQRLSEVRAQ